MKLLSAVILKWPEGYTAELHFEDNVHDVVLSSQSHYQIYYAVEKYMRNRPQ